MRTHSVSARSVELIFRTFARRYLNRWTIAFNDEAARELWRNDLSRERVTDSMVMRGLKSCKLKWPPSPGEFIPFCAPDKPINASHIIAPKALPRPKPDLNKHAERMQDVRAALGGEFK